MGFESIRHLVHLHHLLAIFLIDKAKIADGPCIYATMYVCPMLADSPEIINVPTFIQNILIQICRQDIMPILCR